MWSLLIVALAFGATDQRAVEEVVASNPVVVQTENGKWAVEFTLTNRAKQVVTAWEADVEVTFADNSVKVRGVTVDGYDVHAGLSAASDKIVPVNGSIRRRIPFDDSVAVVALRAAVRWVVFADGSSVGDLGGVQDIFRQREREYEALTWIIGALRAGRAAGTGVNSLRVALEYLNRPDQQDFEHPNKRMMRRNLEMAIGRQPSAVSPNEFLRRWLLRTEELWRVADEYRRPKGGMQPWWDIHEC